MTKHSMHVPSSTDSYTKGGQIFGHVWRMRFQNLKLISMIVLGVFLGTTILVIILKDLSFWQIWDFYICSYLGGHLKVSTFNFFKDGLYIPIDTFFKSIKPHVDAVSLANKSVHQLTTELYIPEWGREVVFWTTRFLKDPWTLQKAREVHACGWWGMGAGVIAFFTASWAFKRKSEAIEKKRILDGLTLATDKQVASIMKSQGIASSKFYINQRLPMVKDSEVLHTIALGTTGVGKTNFFHGMLNQVRRAHQKALVFDTNNGYVNRYFNPETDLILNPLDSRSVNWNLWLDCKETAEFDAFALSLVPTPPQASNPVWHKSAREIVAATAERLYVLNTPSMQELINYASRKPLAEIKDFYKGTSVEGFLTGDEKAEATVKGVRMQILGDMKRLGFLSREEGTFSLEHWVTQDRPGWLFISCSHGDRATLGALMQFWTSLAMRALMKRGEDKARRLWFILDELFSVEGGKLESLDELLREGRKYGASTVLGLQDLGGLEKAYGASGMKSILSLCNTKIIMRTPEPHTADYLSKVLGEQEILEVSENLSIGAHHMRDGINMNVQKRIQPIVTKSALMMMNPHEGYVVLPRSLPIVKVKFDYQDPGIQMDDKDYRLTGVLLDRGEKGGSKESPEDPSSPNPSSPNTNPWREPPQKVSSTPPSSPETPVKAAEEQAQEKETIEGEKQALQLMLEPSEASVKRATQTLFSFRLNTLTQSKYKRILSILYEQARNGQAFTLSSFSKFFAGTEILGSEAGLLSTLKQMSSKGLILYFEEGEPYGLSNNTPGYMTTFHMELKVEKPGREIEFVLIQPTHFIDAADGVMRRIV